MFEHRKIQDLEDFFTELNKRREKGVYFYRIDGYNRQIGEFLRRYYEAARRMGVVIEGRIPNPDERNLAYYEEMMGRDFRMDPAFITSSLRRWLPRMNDFQRSQVASALYDCLKGLARSGKNENMLKNAYIKFMCWLYYKFERIVNQLGENQIPKILYEGDISHYELMLISILCHGGCDVVLLETRGDGNYQKLDGASALSEKLALPGMGEFPEGYGVRYLTGQLQQEMERERLYGRKPSVSACTNAWISGKGLEDCKTPLTSRGGDPTFFYNCFCRITGAEDKLTYQSELYRFYLEMKNAGRRAVVTEGVIAPPSMEEIGGIHRKNYQKTEQMLLDLSRNIRYTANEELQRLMTVAFIDLMLEEAGAPGMNVNRLTNKAVYLLCWLKRFQSELFSNWKMPEIGCFIHLGGCKNENEALFLRLLARLPVDVLILVPNLNEACCLKDPLLYEVHFAESLAVEHFPREGGDIQIGTAAYHAERELDTLMYQDSGMYRDRQFTRANSVTLQTMYEEIALLWKEELKYRPNFDTVEGVVTMPVLFAKVSGVKDGQVQAYWQQVKALITEDTFVVRYVPMTDSTDPNPMKACATEFLKSGKVQKAKIKAHRDYPYGFLREEIQEHMLDKLQMLIDRKLIKGTFENGTEYTIVATVLNLHRELVRLIQRFDFTKRNPKLLYINTGERIISLEDSITAAYLNLVGFDVVFFVPTGYQSVEKYFNRQLVEEHQIGDYVYDLQVPDLGRIPRNTRPTWRDKFFKRGT